jgi:ribonucleoside-diphosphate reductase alpha chain
MEFEQGITGEVYRQNYKYYEDDGWDDTARRVTDALLVPDEDNDRYEFFRRNAYDAIKHRRVLPSGRNIANSGTNYDNATNLSCFVSGPTGEDIDSMEGIMEELTRCAKILASEGGYGFNADFMRPRGSMISGTGARTPGAVEMLNLWDQTSATLTKGPQIESQRDDAKEKIRKGAMMVTMSTWHPDVEEFIEAKQEQGRLSKFNMSVLIPDAFMEAVQNGDEWDLVFPDYESSPDKYTSQWNGSISDWNGPVKTHKTVDARKLWDKIMQCTYNRNEPGVLFYDNINDRNPLWYEENIKATNPCSEWPMTEGGVCNLMNLVLPRYLNRDGEINWNKMARDVHTAIRLADNVNDITYVPFERQRKELKQKRRIGLGHMGFGSLCAMRGIEYGSEESVALAETIQRFITNKAYQASAKLADEKNPFPLYDEEKHRNGDMYDRLWAETRTLIDNYGLRNSHLTSIQPTGNTSVMAGNVSSGIEPIFAAKYTRTVEQPHLPDEVEPPNEDRSDWTTETQGDETVLRCNADGYEEWQIHPTRGIVKDEPVMDYAVAQGVRPDSIVTAMELSVNDHVSVLKQFAKYVDAGISKTVNVPADYPFDEFKDVYESAWKTGLIKGITTYRAGSMSAVLSTDSEETEKSDEHDEQTCAECGSTNVKHEEGCVKCLDCGNSKCEL